MICSTALLLCLSELNFKCIPLGSVVLVLLTKVIENGQELCHKYWPEEGSQLYHIYEVNRIPVDFPSFSAFDLFFIR